MSDSLPHCFTVAKKASESARAKATAIEKHLLEYKMKPKRPRRCKSIAESWTRIVEWMNQHEVPFPLHVGASDLKIEVFEREIGSTLPDDFKESVRIHDGGDCWVPWRYGDLLSLEQILKQWKMYRDWQSKGQYANEDDWIPEEIKGPIKPIFWNLKRIYITDNSGDHLTLDLDPPKKGVYGQVIEHSHEVGPTCVVAKSWSEFLSQLVHDLETGKYIRTEQGGLELFGADEDD